MRAIKTFVRIVDMKLASADDGGVVEVEEKLERHLDEPPRDGSAVCAIYMTM